MAYEKEIKAKLKNNYHANMGLSDASYEKVANILGATIEKEDQIDEAVKGAEGWLKIVQGEADIVRKGNKQTPPTPPTPPTPTPPKEGPKEDKDLAALVKAAIADANKPLLDEINALKADKLQRSGRDKIVALFKEKNIDPNFYEPVIDGRSLTTDDEINALVQSVSDSFAKFEQGRADAGLSNIPKPFIGGSGGDNVSPAVQAFINAKSADKKENSLGGKSL